LLKGPMMYEGLLRVGMILNGPGIPANRVIADPISTIDVMDTVCDYAGASPETPLHSRSLRPLIEGRESRDFAYNEWDLRASRCGVDLRLRTVRTATQKMTVELDSGAGELYDLVNDPYELINRYDDPAYAAARREMQDMIASRPDDASMEQFDQVGMA